MAQVGVVRTARMVLSPAVEADVEDLVAMYQDPTVMATLGGVCTTAECVDRAQLILQQWREVGFSWWIARDLETGRFIGRGGLRRHDIDGTPEVEVGYGFMSEYWGRVWRRRWRRRACASASRRWGWRSWSASRCRPTWPAARDDEGRLRLRARLYVEGLSAGALPTDSRGMGGGVTLSAVLRQT